MKQVYFCHSNRDVEINRYFLELLKQRGLTVRADGPQQDTWCVPKLERHMFASDAFVGVVPRRFHAGGKPPYSQFVAFELLLARRSRVPRLLFVDDLILPKLRKEQPLLAGGRSFQFRVAPKR